MSKKPQHLDDFLRDKLNELPHAPVAGFERVEERMVAKSHRGIVLMLLIPLIATGIYWIGTLTERDLFVPVAPQDQPITNTPGEANQVDLPAVESKVEPQNAQLPEIPLQVFPNEATDNPAATANGTLAVRAGEASEKRIYEPQLTTLSARAPPDVVSTNNYSNTLGHRVVSSTLVSGVLADGESTLFAEGTNLRNQEQSAAAVNPEPVLPIYSAQTLCCPWLIADVQGNLKVTKGLYDTLINKCTRVLRFVQGFPHTRLIMAFSIDRLKNLKIVRTVYFVFNIAQTRCQKHITTQMISHG
jgi:hypothetical protein